MLSNLLSAAYLLSAFAYAGFALLTLRGYRGGRLGQVLLAAAGATVAWSLACAWLSARGGEVLALLDLATSLRSLVWLAFIHVVWRHVAAGERSWVGVLGPRLLIGALAAMSLVAGQVALIALGSPFALDLAQIAIVIYAVAGLAIVESFVKSLDGNQLWASKHLLIALGGLFAFDLFLYSEALLLGRMTGSTRLAQPLVACLAVPLLAVAASRIQGLRLDLPISRQLVVQTTSLIVCGAYLLAVAAAGYLLRSLGLAWGAALQLVFFFGAGLVLAMLLASGEVRARGRRFLARNFFHFSFDYRREWLRFVATMAGGRDHRPLAERAIQAVADPFECSGGVLYLRERGDRWRLASNWNWSSVLPGKAVPAELIDSLGEGRAPLEAGELRELGPAAGEWLERHEDAWFALPVATSDRLIALMMLGKPRLRRRLTWEDHDLLKIFALQVAGYLTEEQSIRALAEAQKFERLSKNFSFIAHDLKNIVSQLSLVVQTAKRRGDNAEFVRDALDTVALSVDKMKSMLLRLRDGSDEGANERVDLRALVDDLVGRKRVALVDGARCSRPVEVVAGRSAMAAVLENLIDNAREAGGEAVEVAIALRAEEGQAALEVRDDGPGMSEAFVRDHLFQPFVSTKRTGFGIGMFQCRDWVERWGGQLEIDSVPGEGTVVRIRLPLAAERETLATRTMAAVTQD
jgi:putative PEP-CTERM system histidine kinase